MASSTLFVDGLSEDTTHDWLQNTFKDCEGYLSCRLRRTARGDRKVGFICFASSEAARKALEYAQLQQPPLTIAFAKANAAAATHELSSDAVTELPFIPSANSFGAFGALWAQYAALHPPGPGAFSRATLHVDHLPSNTTEREVALIFRPFPSFIGVKLLVTPSKLFHGENHVRAFVTFDCRYVAEFCIVAMNGFSLEASHKGLRVEMAKTQTRD